MLKTFWDIWNSSRSLPGSEGDFNLSPNGIGLKLVHPITEYELQSNVTQEIPLNN